jgi:hypothetical protein
LASKHAQHMRISRDVVVVYVLAVHKPFYSGGPPPRAANQTAKISICCCSTRNR